MSLRSGEPWLPGSSGWNCTTLTAISLDPGDLQLINSHVTYHGRTGFTDGPAAGAMRVLLRIWLAAPFTRMLPAGNAVQWGDTSPGALRGGALVGRSALIAA